jgi:hypothetical protein
MPTTLIGEYLKATALGHAEAMELFRAELSRTGWRDVDPVVDATLAAALELWLGRKSRWLAVPRIAVKTVYMFRGRGLRPDNVERVIRASLGEDVSLDRLPSGQAEAIKVLAIASIGRARKLPPEQLEALIVKAERSARDLGHEPTPSNE